MYYLGGLSRSQYMNEPLKTPEQIPRESEVVAQNKVPSNINATTSSVQTTSSSELSLKPPRRKRFMWVIVGCLTVLLLLLAVPYVWYQLSLQPVNSNDQSKDTVTIKEGMTPGMIGDELTAKNLIHNSLAFTIYTRLAGVQNKLQVGTYELSPNMSLVAIVDALVSGKTAVLTITFYPGATLRDPTDIPDSRRTDVFTMLVRAGFSEAEINEALAANYDHPLFAGKPKGTTLEGYVYGETYTFAKGTSAKDVLRHTFDVYYQQLTEHDIISRAKKQGLNLYQTIILGSIIEREVSGAADQRQVAQVFYTRLAKKMSLGSDVTFIYAAQQQNKTPSVDFDSPYNTRIHTGLPPGPIAAPGITALEAVANPAKGDYLYFLAGDDGKTYFAHTDSEHEKNIKLHCQKLCYE